MVPREDTEEAREDMEETREDTEEAREDTEETREDTSSRIPTWLVAAKGDMTSNRPEGTTRRPSNSRNLYVLLQLLAFLIVLISPICYFFPSPPWSNFISLLFHVSDHAITCTIE
jgi:hypothetical protein